MGNHGAIGQNFRPEEMAKMYDASKIFFLTRNRVKDQKEGTSNKYKAVHASILVAHVVDSPSKRVAVS